MRRAYQDMSFLLLEDKIIGVNLGYDFCSEHEWGIDRLRQHLGIPGNDKPENFGLKARTTTRFNETEFYLSISDKWTILIMHGHSWMGKAEYNEKSMLSWMESSPNDTRELITAWSEGQFGIAVPVNTTQASFLQELYAAFEKKDVAIWLGGKSNPFANNGLIICVASKIPQEGSAVMLKADQDRYQLLKDVEDTGIKERLKEAGLKYYALTPRRAEDGSLIFWLNPQEQDRNNFGWFTIADLDGWIAGEGKIPMKKAR